MKFDMLRKICFALFLCVLRSTLCCVTFAHAVDAVADPKVVVLPLPGRTAVDVTSFNKLKNEIHLLTKAQVPINKPVFHKTHTVAHMCASIFASGLRCNYAKEHVL